MKSHLSLFSFKKFKIYSGIKPIEMSVFLSFLRVDLERHRHVDAYAGWTELHGDNDLIISGCEIRGVEYLDSIQYKENIDNKYNNYVNPFFLFEIMNDEGKAFFLHYYKDEINELMGEQLSKVQSAEEKLKGAEEKLKAAKENLKAATKMKTEIEDLLLNLIK